MIDTQVQDECRFDKTPQQIVPKLVNSLLNLFQLLVFNEMGRLVSVWMVLVIILGWIRPMFPSNELHYVSIAWEMWEHHSFILPIQTGLPYGEKTPLLFWLIHLGWWLFGVNSWWPRLVPQLFMLGSLLLTYHIARGLWPQQKRIAKLSPWILLGCFAWTMQMKITWFDMLIIFFCLLSWFFLYKAVQQHSKFWYGFGLAISGGILAKGPVLLLFVLPLALSMPYWGNARQNWLRVYSYLIYAVLFGMSIGLIWALLAIHQGGADYAQKIFFTQSVGRITGQHGGHKAWYFYLLMIPVLLMPWLLWLPLWRSAINWYQAISPGIKNANLRFLGLILFPPVIGLSFFAAKSYSYVFPLLPVIAIFFAYILYCGPQILRRRDQILIALIYLFIGLSYILMQKILPSTMQIKYWWLTDVSSLWGYGILIMGIFWLLWREERLSQVVMGVALTTILGAVLIQIGINHVAAKYNDWRFLALEIQRLQGNHIPVGFPNQPPEELFEFYGKLHQPVVVPLGQMSEWIEQNPEGWLILTNKKVSPKQYFLYPVKFFPFSEENKTRIFLAKGNSLLYPPINLKLSKSFRSARKRKKIHHNTSINQG